MIHLFSLSKNKTRTTTTDELINIMVQNKDLLYKNGCTNIGGIEFYHFQNDNNDAEFSYGSNSIVIKNIPSAIGRLFVEMNQDKRVHFTMRLEKEEVFMADKDGLPQAIPYSGLNDIDFFQYTLLNLAYECSDESIIKLVNLLKEY